MNGFTSAVGQVNPLDQALLDSVRHLSRSAVGEFSYEIDTIVFLEKDFQVMEVSLLYDCYGDLCTMTAKGLITPMADTLNPVFYDILQLATGDLILKGLRKDLQINRDMEVVKSYDRFGRLVNGLAVFVENGLYGASDEFGNVIVSPTYDYLEEIDSQGRMAARNADTWTILLDLLPDEDIEDDWGFDESISLIKVQHPQSRLWALIDEDAKQVTSYNYEEINTFPNGTAAAQLDYSWGLISYEGEELTPFKYDQIGEPSVSSHIISKGAFMTRFGLLSDEGLELTAMKYSMISSFPIFSDRLDDFFWVVKELKGDWGLISEQGKVLTPMIYEEIEIKSYDNPKGLINGSWVELFKK